MSVRQDCYELQGDEHCVEYQPLDHGVDNGLDSFENVTAQL